MRRHGGEREGGVAVLVTVDAEFAWALMAVEDAIYGASGAVESGGLERALEELDRLIVASDAYVASPVSGQVYYSDKFSAVAKSGSTALCIDLPRDELAYLLSATAEARVMVAECGDARELGERGRR
jgi:hypothetical protein